MQARCNLGTYVLVLSLCGCTKDESPRVGTDAGLPSVDSGAAIEADPTCRDDRPVPGTPFAQGGSGCTLPGGGLGIGMGLYGCVSADVCVCKAEAGSATCGAKRTCGTYGQAGSSMPAVYATCSGATQDDLCALPDSTHGRCCAGVCRSLTFYLDDSANCGGCGFACGQGLACTNGSCGDCVSGGLCTCGGVTCPSGRTCAPATCRGESSLGSCHACMPSSCADQPDGLACVNAGGSAGICCNHACVDPSSDNRNCGGCGIVCCPGVQCAPLGWFPGGACAGSP